MSVENLIKELDAVHDKIRSAVTVDDKMSLLSERDQIMNQLVKARADEAAFYQQKIKDLDDRSRPTTFITPFKL